MHVTVDMCKKQVIRTVGMMCLLYLLLLAQFVSAATEEKTSSEPPDSPYETQTAQCTITSGDIEASAQASISKTLVGVCGSDEMLEAFRTLEMKMLEEMYNLRKMIRDPYFVPPPLRPSVYKSIKRTTTASNTSSNTAIPQQSTAERTDGSQVGTASSKQMNASLSSVSTTTPSAKVVFPDDYDDEDEEESSESLHKGTKKQNSELVKNLPSSGLNNTRSVSRLSLDEKPLPPVSAPIDFKPIDKPIEKNFITGGLRDYEVYRFNNTVISSGDAKVFKYFWKIENFMSRVRAATTSLKGATFSSPVFVISGLNLRLHAKTTMKPNGEVLHVQLEQLSASDDALRKTPNVILASGALYGQVETKKFFRHKIMILNQDKPFSDLISTDLTNTNAKFEAPLSALTAEPYLKDDKLLVKVIIFL
ncbi:uncharacterized protein LOC126558135 [Anopheles maculipalpis]|uniref:uncharacterized protein LOC126558135 n=1 Tax=Anopheles maculipalpis TaxID=1496333 RepID=UPI0021593E31|nr:uncharacterized protein LOC126558135 [Anopheles maculipalpis]